MISRPFIERPRLATVVNLIITLAGVIGLMNLAVEEYPNLAPPTLYVSTTYTGASADVVEQTVGMPLEDEINGVEDLLYFSSSSTNDGSYRCSVTFKTGTDTDIAMVNLQNAVKRAEASLPSEVTKNGIQVEKRGSDNLGMIAFMTDGSTYDAAGLVNYVNNNLKDTLARVDGVSSVELMSKRGYAMRIWLDPQRLVGLGMSAEDVRNAVESQNRSGAAGSLGTEGASSSTYFKLNVSGRLTSAEEFGAIVVRSDPESGHQVLLRDVARVELGAESYASGEEFNGQPSVGLGLYRASDANALATMSRVKTELARLQPSLPSGVSYAFGYDPTDFIMASMKEIMLTLGSALVLVIVVTWLFLGSWRATLVPAIAIPISLAGSFGLFWLLGLSINTLTMFGLILVIGSLVDDAIVVVENTERLINDGKAPKVAAIESMHEITGPVIATTLVTLACYAPLIFYGGMVGEIYRQFAISMCVALMMSTVVALTLSPALCAVFLRPMNQTSKHGLLRWSDERLNHLRSIYVAGVSRLLKHTSVSVVVFVLVMCGIGFCYKHLSSIFLPSEDRGAIMVDVSLAQGATQNRTQTAMETIRERIQQISGIESTMFMVGQSMMAGSGENAAMGFISLLPWDQRTDAETHANSIMTAINTKTHDIPAAQVMTFMPPSIMGLGSTGGVTLSFCSTKGDAPIALSEKANKWASKLSESPYVRSVTTNQVSTTAQLKFTIDREKASMLGVSVESIHTVLQNALASYYINDFTLNNNNFEVIMQAAPTFREGIENLEDIFVENSVGNYIPLTNLGTLSMEVAPKERTRFNKMASVDINIQLAEDATSADVFRLVEQTPVPDGYVIEWTNMSRQEKENEGGIVLFTGLALLFAYLFLVALYESWLMPISVMMTVAFALLGGLFGLFLFNRPLDIYAQLGLVMLIGLAAKSAILMVEFSKKRLDEGLDHTKATLLGAQLRFRAVMMTAWSFILGVFPMVIASGAGAASRQSIGITTFVGMIVASVIGIFFTPVFFALVEKMRLIFNKP